MSFWEGANVAAHPRREQGTGRGNQETVEAALSRLSKAYQTAMECVSAWHRADASLNVNVMTKVGRAARKALEEGLLWDPLVLPHISGQAKMYAIPTRRQAPALTSGAHQDMVQKLAYLGLINLSDMLISGRALSKSFSNSLLDKGVVPVLKSFQDPTGSCWDEEEERTVRIALLALLDATAINGSDPTLWLKLASLARRLGRLLDPSGDVPPAALAHRRLEKHALEMGAMSLPPNVPPSKLLQKAMMEWKLEQDPVDYPSLISEKETTLNKTRIVISRYNSWSTLAKTLLRIIRGGSPHALAGHGALLDSNIQYAYSGMSAIVEIDLAPIITLPSGIVGFIFSYLTPVDQRALETTCKELSFNIMSARAALDHSKSINVEEKQVRDNEAGRKAERDREELNNAEVEIEDPTTPTNRVSKRLRTQIITEGKRAERLERRQSVQYCVRAVVLGIASGRRRETDEMIYDWDSYLPADIIAPLQTSSGDARPSRSFSDGASRLREETAERLSVSSLVALLAVDWPISAFGLMFRFVSHISLYIGNVFKFDKGSTSVLASTLYECIEVLLCRSHSQRMLVPSWAGDYLEVPTDAKLSKLDKFSIDLLHGELLLKRIERLDTQHYDFDSDANTLSLLSSTLMSSLRQVEQISLTDPSTLVGLKARLYWLMTGFLLWRSRCPCNVAESRRAEQEAITHLEATIEILGSSCEVVTPHLQSEGKGHDCRVLCASFLEAFQREIKASSVVLATRESFLDAVGRLRRNEADLDDVVDVGRPLVARYQGSGAIWDVKHIEVIDDFVNIYAKILTLDTEQMQGGVSLRDWFHSVVPLRSVDVEMLYSLSESASVSVLSVLSLSLVAKKEISGLLQLYGRLIVALCAHCLSKLSETGSIASNVSRDDTDNDSFDDEATHRCFDTSSLRPWVVLLQLLWWALQAMLEDDQHMEFMTSQTCSCALQLSLKLCAEWFRYVPRDSYHAAGVGHDDLELFHLVIRFVQIVKRHRQLENHLRLIWVSGAARIIVKQTAVLRRIVDTTCGRSGRFLRQRLGQMRADLLSGACCVLGQEFSEMMPTATSHGQLFAQEMLSELCGSLLWLWKVGSDNELQLKDRLIVPVAVAVTGLCGVVGVSSLALEEASVSEFFDSDASVTDPVFGKLDDCGDKEGPLIGILLRKLDHVVHAVNGVFSAVDEDSATSYKYFDGYMTEHGPLLPLVVARVLNRVADVLLISMFDEEDDSHRAEALWKEYPFGTRTTGCMLDTLLYKAYKCLHLFVLSSSNESKDVLPPSNSSLKSKRHNPENLDAAISLYRCIMRAYSQGRKSPPKAALDTVLNVLPPMSSVDGGKRDATRNFLFSPDMDFSLSRLRGIVQQADDWESCFEWLRETYQTRYDTELEHEGEAAIRVRRGISHLLAQGPLPEQGNDLDRSESSRLEEELSKKFSAIIDSQCLGDLNDYHGWYKAAQCILDKANLIADRIGLNVGFTRSKMFVVPERPSVPESRLSLQNLIEEQECEWRSNDEYRVTSLGGDLSLYIRHAWADIASLQACSTELVSHYSNADGNKRRLAERQVYLNTLSLINNKDYSRWQQVWGGLFVSSLRSIAVRCICLSLYVLSRQTDIMSDEAKYMLSETYECLGTILYSDLSASQAYGYPMRPLTAMEKRESAEAALQCYGMAIAALDEDSDRVWDLRRMQGKCHEKIASTFWNESFDPSADTTMRRRYEVHMTSALNQYAESLGASLIDKGVLETEQNGGSDHGPGEVLYRLHATRLKCLINAVNCGEEVREQAENEAIRLTEKHWFNDSRIDKSEEDIRTRVWAVLIDVVDGLAKCRLDHPHFHRSVYRHAQALLWAPVLDDPVGQRAFGSLGSVSATKAAKIRGFNSSNALSSAATVLSVLFERRRAQLCAVWVTTGSGSPFAVINQTVRKYDSVRGKYISAYLDVLRLCNRRDDIESLMKCVYSAGRDLASYFAVTANVTAKEGISLNHSDDPLLLEGDPIASHFFLTSIKRHANGCFAEVTLSDVRSGKVVNANAKESNLKAAYSCFLRLHCTSDSFLKSIRSWKFNHKFDAIKSIALCLIESYLQVHDDATAFEQSADWSGESRQAAILHLALEHCKKTFPNLSGSYYSKKPAQKKKRKEVESSVTAEKSFDIRVPEGSKAGDTFVVSVEMEGQSKRVRLTVPGPVVPAVMRFCLPSKSKDSKSGDEGGDAKKAKT